MVINVSEALDSDTAEAMTVLRTSAGVYTDGLFVAGSTSTFKTLASSQQPSPKQLLYLPEGQRDQDIRLFFCKKAVRAASDRDGLTADKIYYKGVYYEVIKLGDWASFGHTIAFGVRVP